MLCTPRKYLAFLLSFLLVFDLIPLRPIMAVADDGEDEPQVVTAENEPDALEEMLVSDDVPTLGSAPEGDPSDDEALLTLQSNPTYVQAETHTKDDILSFIASNPFSLTLDPSYVTDPSTEVPYAPGELSSESTQNAVNMLNVLRYIAGVGYNVTNDSDYQVYAQAAALVNNCNQQLNHEPGQPANMEDDLYQLGYDGSGRSNLAQGGGNEAGAIIQYFDDLGDNNHGEAGHRRWLISSRLGKVGIGQVASFNATYVFDSSDDSYVTDVAWPARLMPTDFFDSQAQWSFSTQIEDIGSADSITVTVVRRRDNREWGLSNSDIWVHECTPGSSLIGYDKNDCVIWDLDGVGSYLDGDVFDVTLSGDVSSKSYSVEFFDLCSPNTVNISIGGYGTPIENGGTYNVPEGSELPLFIFEPGFLDGTYPTDSTLQSVADRSREGTTITYSSSNENVATVVAGGTHRQRFSYDGETWYYSDWSASVTAVGAGTTTITATLSNGVTACFDLVIAGKSIDPRVDAKARVTADGPTTFTYNGDHQHPTYSVYYNGSKLSEDTDYTVSYEKDVDAGTGITTITGAGGYEGTYTTTFTIKKAPLSDATIGELPSQAYTGEEITPAPEVTLGEKTLSEGSDYSLSYTGNVEVGTGTVTVTGIGNYEGERTVTFEILSPFVDADSNTPHFNDICWLASTGISAGWEMKDGTRQFRPYEKVARADMAAFLFRLAKTWGLVDDDWQPSGSVAFRDVNTKTPHYREIMWLAEAGISQGWPVSGGGREFRPLSKVARADMAAFLFRLAKSRRLVNDSWQPTGSVVFRDVNTKTPHHREIMWLAETGISQGWQVSGGKEFRPLSYVARADMAAFLHRLDLVSEYPGITASQLAVISACYSTPSPGGGLCAWWVEDVFANAGVCDLGGNACDLYNWWCYSSDRDEIQPGMIVAVSTFPTWSSASIYGHVGIYIGGGIVMENIGYINTRDLDSWIATYGGSVTPRWGWMGGIVLA